MQSRVTKQILNFSLGNIIYLNGILKKVAAPFEQHVTGECLSRSCEACRLPSELPFSGMLPMQLGVPCCFKNCQGSSEEIMGAFLCHHKSKDVTNKNIFPLHEILYIPLLNFKSEKYECEN